MLLTNGSGYPNLSLISAREKKIMDSKPTDRLRRQLTRFGCPRQRGVGGPTPMDLKRGCMDALSVRFTTNCDA